MADILKFPLRISNLEEYRGFLLIISLIYYFLRLSCFLYFHKLKQFTLAKLPVVAIAIDIIEVELSCQ
ncbi:MAG: hypothetical protein QNJ18_23145 [Xenococcaceae cyanobacterium MO_167.B52]|nr:hypothetical protein [Xenococcaceae cyanobacterium MO_167.B52]